MKFSIVTCTWNSAAYLRQCIDSVRSQSYQNLECIFVDGGSKDDTLKIIESSPMEKKIANGVSGGIALAMNKGIEMATGDVIFHLHSDDYLAHPHVLQRVATEFSNNPALWLFGRCLSDIAGELLPESYVIPKYNYRYLLKRNFIPHPATFIRKELFDKVGFFDTKLKYAMDYDMWLRAGRIAEPIQLDEHLSVFRRHAGSLSTANPKAVLDEDYGVRLRHSSRAPWWRFYHYAHFLVRRGRMWRELAAGAGS